MNWINEFVKGYNLRARSLDVLDRVAEYQGDNSLYDHHIRTELSNVLNSVLDVSNKFFFFFFFW